jgi:hypothetical protein
MEYDKISTLANIEEQKELLKIKSQNLMNFVYPNTKETSIDKKELLKLMMLDIISTEETIQKQIQGITKNENHYPIKKLIAEIRNFKKKAELKRQLPTMYIKNRRKSNEIKAFGSCQSLCLTESLVFQNPLRFLARR